jgi:hypothetical protein
LIDLYKTVGDLGTAEFSGDDQYRYILTRNLKSIFRWIRPSLFIMLNPSTADANNNDPTIYLLLENAGE